jgi:hypothetical protein
MARTGDARYIPIARFGQRGGVRVQMASRLDEIDFRDYERVRFYPVIKDGIRSIVAPAARANVHFSCDDENISSLAQQELGHKIPSLVRQMLRGALEFGYHAVEIRWTPKFDVFTSSGLGTNGDEKTERYYPFIWSIDRFAHFSPHDTRILVDTLTGDFGGIRQFVVSSKDAHDVPATKCLIYVHDQEFDNNYGVPLTKAAVPFVDIAIDLFDSMGKYAALFAVPGMIGRHPSGRTNVGDGNVVENSQLMQTILNEINSGYRLSMPSDTYAEGGLPKWNIEFFSPVSTSEPYTAMLGEINDQIRMAIGVADAASSQPNSVGGLGDQGAGDKISLHLQNVETWLDDIRPQVDKFLDQFRVYNFGHDAPALRCYFEPVDMNVTKALLAAVVQLLSSGEPIQDAQGSLIYPDWGKILQDKGIPTISVSGKTMAQNLFAAAIGKITGDVPSGRQDGQGEAGGDSADEMTSDLSPKIEAAARIHGIKLIQEALEGNKFHGSDELKGNLRAILADLEETEITKLAEYEESKHPRKSDGKFAPKGEGESGAGGDAPAAAKDPIKHDFGDTSHLPKAMRSPATDQASAYAHATEAAPEFQKLGADLAGSLGIPLFDGIKSKEEWEAAKKATGPRIVVAPLKGEERATSKVTNDYGGDWGQVGDLVRGTVAVTSMADIPGVLEKLEAQGWSMARQPKDRYKKPTEGGYRDIMLNLVAPNGHNVEMQINHATMLDAKGEAHKLYKEESELLRTAALEDRKLTPDEKQRVDYLKSEQTRIYGDAWAKISAEA